MRNSNQQKDNEVRKNILIIQELEQKLKTFGNFHPMPHNIQHNEDFNRLLNDLNNSNGEINHLRLRVTQVEQ